MAGNGHAPLEVQEELIARAGTDLELRERLAELELTLEDRGWIQLDAQGNREMSRGGLKKVVRIARLMYLTNPLVRNAVHVQMNYVWGQGVSLVAREEPVNTVIQAFVDWRPNRREFSGHFARMLKEIELQLTGNIFLALFTSPATGAVRTRAIDVDEIEDIVTNPEDTHEPWFYLRSWNQVDALKPGTAEVRRAYYPDWLYRPKERPDRVSDIDVMWDAPVYHVKTGCLDGAKFGMPEIYAALDWARAVKTDMENYATIRRAHARFAWDLQRKGGPAAVNAAKNRLASTLATDDTETNPPPVTGATFVRGEGVNLQPIRTAGAAPSPDEARRLWLMVAAGTGIPETMLSGDATLGSYATAKSLDRPTELEMRNRHELWSGILQDVLGYVIDQVATSPSPLLRGFTVPDPYTGEDRIQLGSKRSPIDRRIDIRFPSVLEKDIQTLVQATVGAATLNGQQSAGTVRRKTLARLLLTDIGVDNVDEELAEMEREGMFDQQPAPPPPAPPAPTGNPPATEPPPAAPPQE